MARWNWVADGIDVASDDTVLKRESSRGRDEILWSVKIEIAGVVRHGDADNHLAMPTVDRMAWLIISECQEFACVGDAEENRMSPRTLENGPIDALRLGVQVPSFGE